MCFYTPRFSYGCPKLTVYGVAQGCGTGVHAVRGWGAGRVGIQGGYTGVGTGRGTIPGTTQLLGEGLRYSEAGPVGPAGAGVGGI